MLGLSRVAHYNGRLLHGKLTDGMGERHDATSSHQPGSVTLGQGLCR
jgi:hypothetical protein